MHTSSHTEQSILQAARAAVLEEQGHRRSRDSGAEGADVVMVGAALGLEHRVVSTALASPPWTSLARVAHTRRVGLDTTLTSLSSVLHATSVLQMALVDFVACLWIQDAAGPRGPTSPTDPRSG